jgi:hypothetical protein
VALYIPKAASVEPTLAMTGKRVEQYLSALDLGESTMPISLFLPAFDRARFSGFNVAT